MNARDKFERFIAKRGLRQTAQRQQVVAEFLSTERHVTVQDLYDLVRRKHKGIGYATVARTVRLMSESGICRQVDFGDGVQRFEHKYGHEHHDHLICTKCGRFVEIYSEKLEKLQEELVRKHGYVQEHHKLDMFGVCRRCRRKGNRKGAGR
ncbi:MAG: Fur family transcriptional regulator [Planctomycetota bacterium]